MESLKYILSYNKNIVIYMWKIYLFTCLYLKFDMLLQGKITYSKDIYLKLEK